MHPSIPLPTSPNLTQQLHVSLFTRIWCLITKPSSTMILWVHTRSPTTQRVPSAPYLLRWMTINKLAADLISMRFVGYVDNYRSCVNSLFTATSPNLVMIVLIMRLSSQPRTPSHANVHTYRHNLIASVTFLRVCQIANPIPFAAEAYYDWTEIFKRIAWHFWLHNCGWDCPLFDHSPGR